ncbi:hypothetical protein DSL92_08655 [Billgrantia gudaonensis]|uniref:Uncharacterized protein n=1 Tax=Billgrantia gudaonensis TaxID=376427 RepID=A0A432JGB1_9GAMM|nr:hypothetical protein DSL92_08655 [Halomonas gudaonensis]
MANWNSCGNLASRYEVHPCRTFRPGRVSGQRAGKPWPASTGRWLVRDRDEHGQVIVEQGRYPLPLVMPVAQLTGNTGCGDAAIPLPGAEPPGRTLRGALAAAPAANGARQDVSCRGSRAWKWPRTGPGRRFRRPRRCVKRSGRAVSINLSRALPRDVNFVSELVRPPAYPARPGARLWFRPKLFATCDATSTGGSTTADAGLAYLGWMPRSATRSRKSGSTEPAATSPPISPLAFSVITEGAKQEQTDLLFELGGRRQTPACDGRLTGNLTRPGRADDRCSANA